MAQDTQTHVSGRPTRGHVASSPSVEGATRRPDSENRAAGWLHAPPPRLEIARATARFAPDDGASLGAFALKMRAHADLLLSFPAAALAIARQRGDARARAEALRRIAAGAPRIVIARALGFPPLLVRLPPEALHHALPASEDLAFDAAFDAGLIKRMPVGFQRGSTWLAAIVAARASCNDAFALWLAQKIAPPGSGVSEAAASALAAFTWSAGQGDDVFAAPGNVTWSPRLSLRQLAGQTAHWLHDICAGCTTQNPESHRVWSIRRRIHEFEFTPLRTATALRREGVAMRNCLAGYGPRVAAGLAHIYSVQRLGVSVASLELSFVGDRARIAQLKGPANVGVDPDVQAAAQLWLADCAAASSPSTMPLAFSPAIWAARWSHYAASHPRALLAAPDASAAVDAMIGELERIATG